MALIQCLECKTSVPQSDATCPECGFPLSQEIKDGAKKLEAFDFKTASQAELQAEFKRIAKECGDDQFGTKKELHYLPEVLTEKEKVLAFSSGFMDNNTWLVTLTHKRIIFLDKGMIYGLKQEIVNLDKVNAVSGETGMMFGKIKITDGATIRTIENVPKGTVKIFTNKVQEAIDALGKEERPPPQNDPYAQLEKLADLKEKGILTDEEFATEKQKILNPN